MLKRKIDQWSNRGAEDEEIVVERAQRQRELSNIQDQSTALPTATSDHQWDLNYGYDYDPNVWAGDADWSSVLDQDWQDASRVLDASAAGKELLVEANPSVPVFYGMVVERRVTEDQHG